MNRKLIAILMITAILCGMLIGCGKGETSTEPSGSSVPSQTGSVPADDQVDETQDGSRPSGEGSWPQDEIETTFGSEPANVVNPSQPSDLNVQDPKPQHGGSTEATGNEELDSSEPTDSRIHDSGEFTYMDLINMSAAEQAAIMSTFDSPDAFVAWVNMLKDEYENSRIPIDDTSPIIVGGSDNSDD